LKFLKLGSLEEKTIPSTIFKKVNFLFKGQEMIQAQIENEFIGIDGINEVKKMYKELARKASS
jgi:hypothetical protein